MMHDKNVFLIQNVINDLLDPHTSLEAALLKLNYFSRLVKNEKLLRYTELEINGYKDFKVPKYRQTIARLNVVVTRGNHSETIEFPIENLEAPFNTQLRYVQMREGIRIIEAMAERKIVENDRMLGTPVPLGMLMYIKKAMDKIFNKGLSPKSAMISGNPTLTMQIASTVRYRLLALATEMAQQFGYSIEISSFSKSSENNRIITNYIQNQIFNNGNQNITNTGDHAKITKKEKTRP